MYSPDSLRQIIRCACSMIHMWSPEAEDLLLGTAAHESHLGTFTRQVGGGPALGIYQMEPATLLDIWVNYLQHRPWWRDQISQAIGVDSWDLQRLQHDPIYATVMARLHYRRISHPLPKRGDLGGYADYWKQHYNTVQGKGTAQKFINDWRRLVEVQPPQLA